MLPPSCFKTIWILNRIRIHLCYTLNTMFKNAIAPIQAWLLSQGRCVGCGTELTEGKKKDTKHGEQVTCIKCGRIFIHDAKTNKYRRALLEEV
jgi:DNA-directed RNA polymerase subunit RPC12/RpoP